jgi:preprotein translocase subunit SecE
MFERFITFVKESRQELKKVSWPTRQQTIRYTLAVIFMSVVVAIFLGGLDYLFQFILEEIISRTI